MTDAPRQDAPDAQPMQWRKKPVVITAIRYTGDNLLNVLAFTGKSPRFSEWFASDAEYVAHVEADRRAFKIFTLEGVMEAMPGDYVIRGVRGEHYPCKPDIFAATYEPASVRERVPCEGEREPLAELVDALLHSFGISTAPHNHGPEQPSCDCGPEGWGLNDAQAHAVTNLRTALRALAPHAPEPVVWTPESGDRKDWYPLAWKVLHESDPNRNYELAAQELAGHLMAIRATPPSAPEPVAPTSDPDQCPCCSGSGSWEDCSEPERIRGGPCDLCAGTGTVTLLQAFEMTSERVWIVMRDTDYEGSCLAGAFASSGEAEEFANECRDAKAGDGFHVEEWTLGDKPLMHLVRVNAQGLITDHFARVPHSGDSHATRVSGNDGQPGVWGDGTVAQAWGRTREAARLAAIAAFAPPPPGAQP